jgi:hypothetical protein
MDRDATDAGARIEAERLVIAAQNTKSAPPVPRSLLQCGLTEVAANGLPDDRGTRPRRLAAVS